MALIPNRYTRKSSITNKPTSTTNRNQVKEQLTGKPVSKTPVNGNLPTNKTNGKKTLVNKNAGTGIVSAGAGTIAPNKNNVIDRTPNTVQPVAGGSGNNTNINKGIGNTNVNKVNSGTTGENSYQSLINYFKNQNETARKSAIDAIVARINAQKGVYNNQLNELGGQYQALRNQSEVERYKTRSALREAQANRGQLDSGYGRQEALMMDTQYGNAINSINMQEQAARNEIQNLISQLIAEGEADKATVNNQYASVIQQYIDEVQKGSK